MRSRSASQPGDYAEGRKMVLCPALPIISAQSFYRFSSHVWTLDTPKGRKSSEMYTLHNAPFFAARARIYFPKSRTAPESVAIIAALETFRQ